MNGFKSQKVCLAYGVLSLTGKALAWKAGSNR